MKSKKIIAMIVAFAAFMAVATSGLAAVTTTTTYNADAEKVLVEVNVTDASENSEVTYLVKNGENIVYIDQKPANGTGAVNFTYRIDKDDIADLKTTVKFGTNGAKSIDDTKPLDLANKNVVINGDEGSAIVELSSVQDFAQGKEVAVIGNADTTYVRVTAVGEYKVDSVTIGGVPQNDISGTFTMLGNQPIVVTTSKKEVTPSVSVETITETIEFENDADADAEIINAEGMVSTIAFVKPTGSPNVIGVKVGDDIYPALNVDKTTTYNPNTIYAVRIIDKDTVTLTPYWE